MGLYQHKGTELKLIYNLRCAIVVMTVVTWFTHSSLWPALQLTIICWCIAICQMQDQKYCFANVAAVLLSVTQLLYKPYHYNHWVNVRSYQCRLPRNTQVYPVPVPCPLSLCTSGNSLQPTPTCNAGITSRQVALGGQLPARCLSQVSTLGQT